MKKLLIILILILAVFIYGCAETETKTKETETKTKETAVEREQSFCTDRLLKATIYDWPPEMKLPYVVWLEIDFSLLGIEQAVIDNAVISYELKTDTELIAEGKINDDMAHYVNIPHEKIYITETLTLYGIDIYTATYEVAVKQGG